MSSTTTIVFNQLSCQVHLEVLDRYLRSIWCVVFDQDEGICDGNIIIVRSRICTCKFSYFDTAMIVSSQLISSVNSTHVGVIQDDGLRAWH